MIDRQLMAETQAELDFVATANVPTRELARLGNQVGTDYLVVLELRDLVTTVSERKMATSNRIRRKTVLTSEVGVRIDVATVDQTSRNRRQRRRQLTGPRAERLARAIGAYIQNAHYPIRIININGGVLTLGQGGKTIERGEQYSLNRLGKRLFDPYTKESLGYEETPVGTVVITSVRAKQSKATVDSFDSLDIFGTDGMNMSSARWSRPSTPKSRPRGDVSRKPKGQVQSLKDKFDE